MSKIYWRNEVIRKCHWVSNTGYKDKFDFEDKVKELKSCIKRYEDATERIKKEKSTIHKYIEKEGENFYLCNQAALANFIHTDIFKKRINCKNCLRILKKENARTDKG